MKILLDNGARVNEKDQFGWTPLYYADQVEAVKLLIANGADVNASDKVNVRPISLAAIKGNFQKYQIIMNFLFTPNTETFLNKLNAI